MDIPRDVLIAGVRAYVASTGAWATEYPAVADEEAQAILDGRTSAINVNPGALRAALVAAIEAWETRPHPWAPAPEVIYGTSGGVPVTDAVVSRLADEAERGYAVPWAELPADCDPASGYHATPHRGCILRATGTDGPGGCCGPGRAFPGMDTHDPSCGNYQEDRP